jgi:cell filamentation protein
MERVESAELVSATRKAIDETRADQRFTADHIRYLHRMWLEKVYPWAGEYRTVNLSKDAFPFAAAQQVPRLMRELERGPLRRFTPCRSSSRDEISTALAAVHAELILIHPFRDGNGRCARLTATLMALQANLPPLDFSGVHGSERRRYFDAVHAAMAGDLRPMITVFDQIMTRTLKKRRS